MTGLSVAVLVSENGYAMQVLPEDGATELVEQLQAFGEVTVVHTNETKTRRAHRAAERWIAKQREEADAKTEP